MRHEEILVLTAVQMENHAVRKFLSGRSCRFHTAGIRAGHLPEQFVLDGVAIILLCGVGGALDPTLQIGDVVLDDPENHVTTSNMYRRGTIHTASEIIATPAKKTALFAETNALAVDMEQSIVRRFAAERRLPVIGIRAISDRADEVLDPAVIRMVDDFGKPKVLTLAGLLIRRPDLIPYLKRLGANTKLAVDKLGKATAFIVDELTGGN